MERLVQKIFVPYYGEMYVALMDEVSIETMSQMQKPLKKLYEYEEAEEKKLLGQSEEEDD